MIYRIVQDTGQGQIEFDDSSIGSDDTLHEEQGDVMTQQEMDDAYAQTPEGKLEANRLTVEALVADGYTDLGYANSGAKFTVDEYTPKEELDCSLYPNRGTNVVYIDHTLREILHVDMSD